MFCLLISSRKYSGGFHDQFLEEAKRRHERETEQEEAAASYSSPSPIQQAKVVGRNEEEEKKKKINNNKNSRWKDTLFFWRKSEKKIKPKHELLTPTPTPTRESAHKNTSFRHVFSKATSGRRAVSGPIHAGGEQVCHLTRWNSYRASNTSRDAEIEISYTALDQLNQPRKMDGAFGPIYLVT